MLKYKPEDFRMYVHERQLHLAESAASTAQQIFDAWIKENGKVVHSKQDGPSLDAPERTLLSRAWFESDKVNGLTHKALLINIEPLVKCTHPKEKVRPIGHVCSTDNEQVFYGCECGAKVRPKEFEEIDS